MPRLTDRVVEMGDGGGGVNGKECQGMRDQAATLCLGQELQVHRYDSGPVLFAVAAVLCGSDSL